MTKTHLSVWVLPRTNTVLPGRISDRADRAGAFIVASCLDEDFAVEPGKACNINRAIWPSTAPTRPRILAH